MTRKDYELHAKLIGHALACAYIGAVDTAQACTATAMPDGRGCDGMNGCKNCARYGENARTLVYDNVYTAFVAVAKLDNPRFDESRFSYATAQAEHRFMGNHRGY